MRPLTSLLIRVYPFWARFGLETEMDNLLDLLATALLPKGQDTLSPQRQKVPGRDEREGGNQASAEKHRAEEPDSGVIVTMSMRIGHVGRNITSPFLREGQ